MIDTNLLVAAWKRLQSHSEHEVSKAAEELIRDYDANAILSPIYLEFICWFSRKADLGAALTFLGKFEVIDGWDVRRDDLLEANRIAQRIPRSGKPRQMGDCLIRAMASRLRYDVFSLDKDFPR